MFKRLLESIKAAKQEREKKELQQKVNTRSELIHRNYTRLTAMWQLLDTELDYHPKLERKLMIQSLINLFEAKLGEVDKKPAYKLYDKYSYKIEQSLLKRIEGAEELI